VGRFSCEVVTDDHAECVVGIFGDLPGDIGYHGPETGELAWMIDKSGECLHREGHIDIPTRRGDVSADAVEVVKQYVGTQLIHGARLTIGPMGALCGCVDAVPDRCCLICWKVTGVKVRCPHIGWFDYHPTVLNGYLIPVFRLVGVERMSPFQGGQQRDAVPMQGDPRYSTHSRDFED
jgi:hypothetical protein